MIRSLFDRKKGAEVRQALRSGKADDIFRDASPQQEPRRGSQAGFEVLIPSNLGVGLENAIAQANAAKKVMASNKRVDPAVRSDEWKHIKSGLPCWTGTVVAYETAETPFGKSVEYTDERTGIRYVFPVPDEFVGVKNGALVVEHPGFTFETDGDSRIVRAAKAELVERFPATNGWYLTDMKFGIPIGEKVDSATHGARFLCRTTNHVGSVVRNGGVVVGENWRVVGADSGWHGRAGVVVEAEKTKPTGGIDIAFAPTGFRGAAAA